MLIIWLVIWIVSGLLVGALASLVTKGKPPYGLAVDLIASLLTTVAVGLVDFYLLPRMGITGLMRSLASLFDPLGAAVLVLWLLRVVKRRRGG